ncbi:epidermal growth factor-like protein 7 isoform 2-T2 [Rhynochetos jubatus]
MPLAGGGRRTFTLLFSGLQGSPLKGETCGRSQRFPPKSETRLYGTAQGAAGRTGHAPHRLPPLGTPHPRCDHHGRLSPGRPQGLCRGAAEPRGCLRRVPHPAGLPALPHHLPGPPPLQHLQDHLQGCLPAGVQAAASDRGLVLSRLEESSWPRAQLQQSSLLGAVPERRELHLPRQMRLPARLDGANLRDRAVPVVSDVDECAGQSHGCGQLCINTAGSYRCACQDGFHLAADDKACQPLGPAPEPESFSQAGSPSEIKEEMQELKSRVEALEQKLQLVLAPFHNLMPSAPEDVGADPISRLSHSLQQLDRIDSLSEQISFLEERLETCSCKNEL